LSIQALAPSKEALSTRSLQIVADFSAMTIHPVTEVSLSPGRTP